MFNERRLRNTIRGILVVENGCRNGVGNISTVFRSFDQMKCKHRNERFTVTRTPGNRLTFLKGVLEEKMSRRLRDLRNLSSLRVCGTGKPAGIKCCARKTYS